MSDISMQVFQYPIMSEFKFVSIQVGNNRGSGRHVKEKDKRPPEEMP